jgi:hypothetical protein
MMRPPPPKQSFANNNQKQRRNNAFSRPPPPPRHSLDNAYRKNPAGNYTAHGPTSFAGPGFFSANDTRSSLDDSRNSEMSANSSSAVNEANKRTEFLKNAPAKQNKAEDDTEPEWFSFPATRHDFVDLHGFNDEDILKPLPPPPTQRGNFDQFSKHNARKQQSPRFDNGNSPNQQYPYHNHNDNNAFMYQSPRTHTQFYNRGPNNSYQGNNNNNSNNQRFRNPLHHTKSCK